jgi:hypothetical protein
VCNHLRSTEGLPNCQHIRAARIDAAVADAFLTALAPAELEALSRARRLRANAERQLERKRYAVAPAERQFNRVDPDNRLVAAELERRWEMALNEVRAAGEALTQRASDPTFAHMGMGKTLQGKVVSVAGRLPQIWTDPTTLDAQRKALLRCLIENVVLDRGEHDIAWVRVVWRGGAVTNLEVKMKVNSITMLTRGMEMRDRVLDLARDGIPDVEIASVLTGEGHRSPDCVEKALPITVQRIRHAAGIQVSKPRSRWSHDARSLSAPELTAKLGFPVNCGDKGEAALGESAAQRSIPLRGHSCRLDGIQSLRNHTIKRLDLRICQPHREGHQHG